MLLAVLTGGCAGPSGSESTPTSAIFEAAPCPQPNVPGVPAADLGPEFSCGFLTVPENRSIPDGRTIKVAVARAAAQSPQPRPDPLVYLTGGPGGSGLALGNSLVGMGLNRDRDLILVDQRGTLHAEPALFCPELDEFNAVALSMSTQDPATGERGLNALRACHDRLTGDGIDLSAFNTPENVADIADLRTALGIAEWNVYGVSYGSDIALQLVRDRPDGIRSVVLDSLVPPQVNLVEQMWPSAAEGLAALFDACAAQPSCDRAYPDLAGQFSATVRRLAAEPMVVNVPGAGDIPPRRVIVDGYQLANMVISATLNTSAIPGLPKAIHAFATNDVPTLLDGMLAPVATGASLVGAGLTYGVFCREGAASTDTPTVLALAQPALPGLPAEVLSLVPQIPRIIEECGVWNAGRADPAVLAPVRSDIPTLLLTGTLDAVTPPSQAELAAEGLPNGRVVRIPGSGHDVLSQSPCAQQITIDFLDAPTDYDAGCAAAVQVPAFD